MPPVISIVVSITALAVSMATAWLTLFRRGTVRMTQPTTIYFGADSSASSSPKVYLRTLLYSTAKRGQIIESMFVKLRRGESIQTFNIWVYGEGSLARSITVRIETDPSIRPGNPIISQTSSARTTKQVDANGNVVNSATATQGLPTATGSRDANGNPVLNIQQDAKNPLEPQSLTPGISSNLNVTVGGSSVTTAGTVSGTPSFELNVSTAAGADVNVPLQTEPSGMSFGLGLFQTNSILNVTQLPPTPPPCAQNKGSGCNQ